MNPDLQITDLLRQLRDDTTTLVREEVALAKTEIGEKTAVIARTIGLLATGACIAAAALVVFLMSLAYLMTTMITRNGVDPVIAGFFGFLTVSVIAGIASAAIINKSLKTLGMENVTPEKTVQSFREDKQWAQSKIS